MITRRSKWSKDALIDILSDLSDNFMKIYFSLKRYYRVKTAWILYSAFYYLQIKKIEEEYFIK